MSEHRYTSKEYWAAYLKHGRPLGLNEAGTKWARLVGLTPANSGEKLPAKIYQPHDPSLIVADEDLKRQYPTKSQKSEK
jgi:hypothetical protein